MRGVKNYADLLHVLNAVAYASVWLNAIKRSWFFGFKMVLTSGIVWGIYVCQQKTGLFSFFLCSL